MTKGKSKIKRQIKVPQRERGMIRKKRTSDFLIIRIEIRYEH